jgi:predicted  nucleic acid-binding Zn-ribbon protein
LCANAGEELIMTQSISTAAEYEAEIYSIETELESLEARVGELQKKHGDLTDKRKYLDIAAALECIESLGLSLDDVLDLLNKELTSRRV